MLRAKNKVIVTPIIDILQVLRYSLHSEGIYKLKDIKPGSENIQITCPKHKEGMERKPSCGVSIVPKENLPAGTVHCFTCSYKERFEVFVSNCFGYDDNGKFGYEWLLENFIAGGENVRSIPIIKPRNQKEEKIEYITEKELDKYRYYHPYMYKRKLTDEIIEKFDVGYDEENKCLTFPVWDKNGNCLFLARRSVKTKFFNYPKNVDKPLYARHFITPETKTVIVTESIINCLTCWVYGKPAVSLIGLGNKQQIQELKELYVRKIILALDPDEEGIIRTQKIRDMLKNSGKIISEYLVPDGKDINNLSEKEFTGLEEYY
jgi:DNA primase